MDKSKESIRATYRVIRGLWTLLQEIIS